VGTLGLADFDTVERSNLQRQIVHGESRLGVPKATSARDRIKDLNPDVETVVYQEKVSAGNAGLLLESWDIVVDGTDSFSSRYALNDACVRQSKPLVYGAVMRFQGQVSVFWPASGKFDSAPCFRCMVPQEPTARDAPGCAQAGVLGVLPGIVGTLQANEALKLALEIGQPLIGSLLMIDALNMEFRKMRVPADPECESCGL
jgi:molybdopterin/thiamine biosynthesis adenylyltransferase